MTFTQLKKEYAKHGIDLHFSHDRKYLLTKPADIQFSILYLVKETFSSRVRLEAEMDEIIYNFQTEWPLRLKCSIEAYNREYPDAEVYKKDMETWHQIYDWQIYDWIETDSCQHVRKICDTAFELIEIGSAGSDQYEVYTDSIDVVTDYVEGLPDELKMILKSYGYSGVEAVREQYNDATNQIIAECIFEYYRSFQAETVFTGTFDQCKDYVMKFIQGEDSNS